MDGFSILDLELAAGVLDGTIAPIAVIVGGGGEHPHHRNVREFEPRLCNGLRSLDRILHKGNDIRYMI